MDYGAYLLFGIKYCTLIKKFMVFVLFMGELYPFCCHKVRVGNCNGQKKT